MHEPLLAVALQDRWWIPRELWAQYISNDSPAAAYARHGAVNLHQLAADGELGYLRNIARTIWSHNLGTAADRVRRGATGLTADMDDIALWGQLTWHNITYNDTCQHTNRTDTIGCYQKLPLTRWLNTTLSTTITNATITDLLHLLDNHNPPTERPSSHALGDAHELANIGEHVWAYCALSTGTARQLHGYITELLLTGADPADIIGAADALTPTEPAAAATGADR
jgi:hypothetical protein